MRFAVDTDKGGRIMADTAEEAVKIASKDVYRSMPYEEAVRTLKAGKRVAWCYGFASVWIEPVEA